MEIECDAAKDEANRRKHRISLHTAVNMDLATAMVVPDERYDYGEKRFQALGLIGKQLHMLVFTMRGEKLRAISLRVASREERKRYGEKA